MVANIIVAAVVLFHALQLPSMSKGQALQWQVNKTSEIIFGQSEMELICSGTACCTGAVRRWTEEPSATILMSNGVPSDPTKYEEILKTNSFSLIFKTLELADVNLQYMCTIDFDDSLATLLLPTADVFRYVPDSSEIEIERNLTGSNIYLTANLTRVFPEPTCTAILEESNITSSLVLTTYDNTPVKFTIIEMNNIPYQCSNGRGNLFISCYVGSIKFTVIQEELCQSTDSCDFNYWYCIGYILLAVFIASGICTLVVVLWWKIKRKEIKAKSILCWLAEHRFCCCAQKIKSFCEKYKNTRIWGAHVLLLADVLVIGMVVSIVVWLVAVIVVILTCCACKELSVKFAVAGISFLLSLFASPIWTAIVLIVYRIASCCKNNECICKPDTRITKEAGDDVNLLEQRAHEFKKIKSIDLTKDGTTVSSDEYEVEMKACPSLTLRMVSLNQSGKYECTISYDLTKKEVHKLNLLVTPKQYEVKMGDRKTLLKFLKNLNDIEDVKWTYNNKAFPADSCFYKGGTRSNPALTVKYCSTSDSGLYICNIRTTQSSKRFSAQLKTKVTDEIIVDVGGKLTLLENLIIKDKDVEDVDWYHNGNPIPPDWGFFYDVEKQTCAALTINLVAANLKGKYQCFVKSTKDPETKVFEVQVNVIDSYTVDSGKNIDLLKDLSSFHGIKQISWVLDGKPLKLAENPSYIGGTKDCPVLTVYCATREESGKYTCILEFESQPTKELNFKLDVNEQRQVDSGDSIVLLDKLGSSNVASVAWTHKERPVKCLHKGGTIQCPALTIPVISLQDSGEYECKITLQQGNVRLYRFVVKVNVQKIKKKVGDRVILLQNLKSAGTIQEIDWYKNGRKVDTDKYQGGIDKSPGLLVGPLGKNDSGRYQCDLIVKESQIKLHILVDLTVEQKENSTSLRLGPVIRNNRVHNSTENNQS